ncbi:MAG: hypothetical protein IMY82_02320 [Chloroflexi bacterium]|nr:hypothetical protein [Chloroflexota bacterium]
MPWLLTSFGFWTISEPDIKPSDNTLSFSAVLRAIPRHLCEDLQLRRYILLVNLSGFGLTLIPFYVAYASHHYELTGEQVGTYLLVQIVGMVASNILWAKLVGRFGFRGVIRACIICGILLSILTLVLAGTP